MNKRPYISKDERKKCRKVVDAYRELYKENELIVLDAGNYGYVKLQFYKYPNGFESVLTYTDSESLFHDLWKDWINLQLISLAIGTPLEYMTCRDMFNHLPKEKQDELMQKQVYFAEKADIIIKPNHR